MFSAGQAHRSSILAVEESWIDFNGHLNMAYYNVLFDHAVDEVFLRLGMGPDYARNRGFTTYAAECHVCYVRELHLGDRVVPSFQLLDHDEKRLHFMQELYHTDGWLAATCEGLALHIDRSGPRVAPFPPDVMARIEELSAAHSGLPTPQRAGRTIGIRRKG